MSIIMFNADPLKAKRLKSPVNRDEFINISKLSGNKLKVLFNNTQVENKGLLQGEGRE